MEKHKGGRPTKFDDKRIQLILNAISQHVPYRIAIQANGIGERTFYYWLKQGVEDLENGVDSNFSRFLKSLRKVEQEKIIEYIKNIKLSNKGHKGCQWILEHVFWKYFSSSAPLIELSEEMERFKREISSKPQIIDASSSSEDS